MQVRLDSAAEMHLASHDLGLMAFGPIGATAFDISFHASKLDLNTGSNIAVLIHEMMLS